ncbi:MAG: hypothetical protein H6925_06180 [Holosporaceae bacterium]|nr:MAG: hypothetical protein H6925_06180 [Holosporaceae bacterium]
MQNEIIHAFLKEIIASPWRDISIDSVARNHSLPKDMVEKHVPRPMDFFGVFTKLIESHVYEALASASIEIYKEKDKVTEVLMTKFEAMHPYKYFYAHIKNHLFDSADVSFTLALEEYNALARLLRRYVFIRENMLDRLKIKGLYGIYALAVEAWVKDDTPDLSVTLETIDNLLRKGETFLERYQ